MAKGKTVKVTMEFSEEALKVLEKLAEERKESPAAVIGEGIALTKWFNEHKGDLILFQEMDDMLVLTASTHQG